RGIVIDGSAFPPYVGNVTVTVTSDDPSVTGTFVSTNPLEVRVPSLPGGASLTIQVTADAPPGCADSDFTDVATVSGVNVMPARGNDGPRWHATQTGGRAAGCPPGTRPSCHAMNACPVDGCDPQSGCTHDPTPGCVPCTTAGDCGDDNACTTDACEDGACAHA